MTRETLGHVLVAVGFSGSVFCLVVVMLSRGDYYLLALPISNFLGIIGSRLSITSRFSDDSKGVKKNG